jgi:ketosteroid isomerase-like protein
MSHENVELTKAACAAINRRDIEALLALVDPQVEFRSLIAEVEGRAYHGHSGVREWWGAVVEPLGAHWEPEEIRAVGDEHVVHGFRVVGVIEGIEVPQRMWQVIRVRHGLVTGWDTFRTEAETLKAAGLRE